MRYPIVCIFTIIIIGLLLFTGASTTNAQSSNVKLNGSFLSTTNMTSILLSPDSNRVVYTADQDTNNVLELYSVPVAGGTPVKLNGTLVSGGTVSAAIISPDSSRVIYIADQDTDGTEELYSVPIGGGTPIKLNSTLVSGGNINKVTGITPQVSPDSTTVIYSADQETDGTEELYSVPISGGTPVKLNGTLRLLGRVLAFEISPDSKRVVYRATQDNNGPDLYSVPIGGGAFVKLNGPLINKGATSIFRISADSKRVVYEADRDTDNVVELYSVPIGGGAFVKLNGPIVSGGGLRNFEISADNQTVVYLAEQDTDTILELYSVPIGGGNVVKLNSPLASGGSVTFYEITPDSNKVVYVAQQDTVFVNETYSVPVGGGPTRKLNGPVVSGGSVNNLRLDISADSRTVAYRAVQTTAGTSEAYAMSLAGCQVAIAPLNGTLVSGGNVVVVLLTPDGSRVVYAADQDTAGLFELYSVRVNATNPLSVYDVNTDSVITPADGVFVVNRINSPITNASANADVDCNGTINANDANAVNQRLGQTIN
ncbi:MAG: dockerin type I domain-containing protein [Chloroflexota bacterium]